MPPLSLVVRGENDLTASLPRKTIFAAAILGNRAFEVLGWGYREPGVLSDPRDASEDRNATGEALALKWNDLDFTNREILIERAISSGVLGSTKTGTSR